MAFINGVVRFRPRTLSRTACQSKVAYPACGPQISILVGGGQEKLQEAYSPRHTHFVLLVTNAPQLSSDRFDP